MLLIPGHGAVDSTAPDPVLADLLTRHGVTMAYFAGGPNSILDSVVGSLTWAGVNHDRMWGPDRYATSIVVNAAAFRTAPQVYVASGAGYPDALGGAALAGATSSPLYVVPPGCLSSRLLSELNRLGTTHLTLVGGPAALSPAVEQLTVCGR